MTREEAADILRKLNYIQCTGEPTIDEQMAAVKMAIGCLEYGKNCIAALRRPRLTEEQVRRLKALYDYGMRWMFFSHPTARDPWLYATTNKPSCTKPDWDGERLRIKGSPLNELERVCADSPLDIVQTLRDAGRLEDK